MRSRRTASVIPKKIYPITSQISINNSYCDCNILTEPVNFFLSPFSLLQCVFELVPRSMPYKNIDEKKACQRRNYLKHKEKNIEKIRARSRRWNQANKEKRKEYEKIYLANPINKQRIKERIKKDRKKPIIKEKLREYQAEYYAKYNANPLNKKLANIRSKEFRLRNQRATREFYEGKQV